MKREIFNICINLLANIHQISLGAGCKISTYFEKFTQRKTDKKEKEGKKRTDTIQYDTYYVRGMCRVIWIHRKGAPHQDLGCQGSFLQAVTPGWGPPTAIGLRHRASWPCAGKDLTVLFTFQNVAEAQCIANQVQLFYATDRRETYGLVETFNFRPNEFKYMSVIAELEQSGLGAELKCSQNQDKT